MTSFKLNCTWCIKESGIFLAPGSGYKAPYATLMVLSIYIILGNYQEKLFWGDTGAIMVIMTQEAAVMSN